MKAGLERRLREHRQRMLIRSWRYRQRHLAHGVWFRLRRTLVDARGVYVISSDDARALLDEGFVPEPVGRELEPNKTIVFVPQDRIDGLASARAISPRLSTELLGAPHLALTRFAGRSGPCTR
jgi:hypothetical protein